MKKALIFAAITTIAAAVATAVEWGNLDNLAKGATVTVSSNSTNAQNITDDNVGTSWQATPSTHNVTSDWALIDLGESKEFNIIEIFWEASHPSAYSVYVSETAIPYEIKEANVNTEENPLMLSCGFIDSAWLESATPFATRTLEGEASCSDVISNSGNGRYILIYTNEYNNFARQYGVNIFEVKVANVTGTANVDNLSLNDVAVTQGASAEVTVSARNILGEELPLDRVENLTLTCSDPAAVEITGGTDGVFTVKGLKTGNFTLTATATANGATVSGTASCTVSLDWSNIAKLDLNGKTVYGRYVPGTDYPHTLEMAIDGDEDTYYEYNGAWGGGESWFIVDLGSEHIIESIGASYGDLSGGTVKFGYALELGTFEDFPNNSQWAWGNDAVPAGWTHTAALQRASNAVVTHTFDTPVRARYISVRDADNPNGKPQLKELYLKGEQVVASVATSLSLSVEPQGLFAGETATVSCSVLDQYGNAMSTDATPAITVSGADYADGIITAGAKGKVTVSATLGDLTAETAITVADVNDYCIDGATITSDTSKSDAANATDGGSAPTNTGNLFVITENESEGEHEHWILADLHKPYDLDMIIAIWEGACPADYDVYVGPTEDSLVKLYSVSGHTQATWYDRFSGREMTNVRFIKIVTTRNATVYGIKLYDLKAYGTSNVESIPTSITLSANGDFISTGETVELSGAVLDQFGGTMSGLDITYSCNNPEAISGNNFKASATGTYSVTATYGNLTSEPVEIHVVAKEDATLASSAVSATLNGTAIENYDIATTELQPALNEPIEITLDKEYDFSLIKLRWEAACPSDYTVTATDAAGNSRTILTVTGRAFQAGFNPVDRIINESPAANGMMRVNAIGTSSLAKVKKLTILPTAKKGHDWTLRLFGIDLYKDENSDPNAIDAIEAESHADTSVVYDLMGRRVANPTHGIFIINGKKVRR